MRTAMRPNCEVFLRIGNSSPDTVEGEGVGAELIRVIRKIAQIQKRLSEIESEIQQLNTSDLYQLRAKADEAETQGRDLLKEMASQLETQISTARNDLTTVSKKMQTHE